MVWDGTDKRAGNEIALQLIETNRIIAEQSLHLLAINKEIADRNIDLKLLKQTIEDTLVKEVVKVSKCLFGEKGDNGLVGEHIVVKENLQTIKTEFSEHKKNQWNIPLLICAILTALWGGIEVLKSLVKVGGK